MESIVDLLLRMGAYRCLQTTTVITAWIPYPTPPQGTYFRNSVFHATFLPQGFSKQSCVRVWQSPQFLQSCVYVRSGCVCVRVSIAVAAVSKSCSCFCCRWQPDSIRMHRSQELTNHTVNPATLDLWYSWSWQGHCHKRGIWQTCSIWDLGNPGSTRQALNTQIALPPCLRIGFCALVSGFKPCRPAKQSWSLTQLE